MDFEVVLRRAAVNKREELIFLYPKCHCGLLLLCSNRDNSLTLTEHLHSDVLISTGSDQNLNDFLVKLSLYDHSCSYQEPLAQRATVISDGLHNLSILKTASLLTMHKTSDG